MVETFLYAIKKKIQCKKFCEFGKIIFANRSNSDILIIPAFSTTKEKVKFLHDKKLKGIYLIHVISAQIHFFAHLLARKVNMSEMFIYKRWLEIEKKRITTIFPHAIKS